MNYSDYRPVGGGERLLAFIGNLFLCALIANGMLYIGDVAGLTDKETVIFSFLGLSGAVLLSCIYPESPCKRLGRFRILTPEKDEIEFKKRALRASPYLVLLLGWLLIPMLSNNPEENNPYLNLLILLPYFLSLLFILTNGLCIFFHPEKKSLLDMKLNTQVMKPPPTPEHLKPRMFGRKII